MKAGLELDLRWCLLFLSLLITAVFWHLTWVLILNTAIFSGFVIAYFTVLQRHLDQLETAFRTHLMEGIQREDRAYLSKLIHAQWQLASLGRRYVLDGARGMVELLNQRPADAHHHFMRAFRSAPFAARITIEINLINTEIAMGLTEAAIDRCRHVLRYRPNSPMIREKLATLLENDLALQPEEGTGE